MKHVLVLSFLLLAGGAAAQCEATAYGKGCGPILKGEFVPKGGPVQMYVETLSGGYPSSYGIMIWGTRQLDVLLPNGCYVLTDFVYGHLYRTDAGGGATLQRAHNGEIIPGFFFSQHAVVRFPAGGAEFQTTNGLKVGCN